MRVTPRLASSRRLPRTTSSRSASISRATSTSIVYRVVGRPSRCSVAVPVTVPAVRIFSSCRPMSACSIMASARSALPEVNRVQGRGDRVFCGSRR
jgi:hypothetical protein